MREISSVRHSSPPVQRKKTAGKAETAAEPKETFQSSGGSRKTSARGARHTAQASAAQAAGMVLGAGLGVVAIIGNTRNPELKKLKALVEDVRDSLTPDLRKKEYQDNPNPMAGHCYVASEAVYHTVGGKEAGWKPMSIQHEGGPHWYLKNDELGIIVDPTADQFKTPVPYDEGRGTGFLTRQPSKRAKVVLDRLLGPDDIQPSA